MAPFRGARRGAPRGSGSSRPTASLRLSRARFLLNRILGIPRNSLLTGNYRKNGTLLIEAANQQRLQGVFGSAAWTDKAQMPDETLKNLIEHFSKHTLSLANVPEDELGNGYEYLIKQFADDSGHTAQEFYTNRTLVHLMAQMLEPKAGETIYDPTCGTGGMLISCLAEVKRNGGDTRTIGLYGQELINITAAIARMNLVLHGVSDFDIRSGNTLHDPALIEADRLKTFDVVLANPPYSIKKWNRDAWQSDPWGRNSLGTPPQGRADYAFFQHILKSMDPKTGRCAILFPHGVLFRNEEAEMRQKLVEKDLLECVLGLGGGLFYNSPMKACVILCRSSKPESRKEKVLFIDAVDEAQERSPSFLRPENQEKISDAYMAFADQEGFARVVDTKDILALDGSLSLARYIQRPFGDGDDSEHADLGSAWAAFEEEGMNFWSEMNALFAMLDSVSTKEACND